MTAASHNYRNHDRPPRPQRSYELRTPIQQNSEVARWMIKMASRDAQTDFQRRQDALQTRLPTEMPFLSVHSNAEPVTSEPVEELAA